MWDVLTPSTDKTAFRPLNAICIYYGSKIGWYITFLYAMAGLMLFPTIAGSGVFIYQYFDLANVNHHFKVDADGEVVDTHKHDDRLLADDEGDGDGHTIDTRYVAPCLWIPIYAIFISIWSTYFLEKWNRRQNEMKVTWDLHHFKEEEQERKDFHGDYIVDKIS
jgi:hypothetical protein